MRRNKRGLFAVQDVRHSSDLFYRFCEGIIKAFNLSIHNQRVDLVEIIAYTLIITAFHRLRHPKTNTPEDP